MDRQESCSHWQQKKRVADDDHAGQHRSRAIFLAVCMQEAAVQNV